MQTSPMTQAPTPTKTTAQAIRQMLEEKNALLLAHYYQRPEIQELAHHTGDSLALAQKAAQTDADIIVLAGVHFMAETAKILNPGKKVLLPSFDAGCSLADSCPPEDFAAFTAQHPDHVVITYVNASAQVKALSDLVCTSSNAEKIIRSVPPEKPILFGPDQNLGRYLSQVTGREMLLWPGACTVHEAFDLDKLVQLQNQYPEAHIIAHPESQAHILRVARHIGSTSALLRYVKEGHAATYIVATEEGILHQMRKDVPEARLIPAPIQEDNTCACSECAFMKVNTLDKLRLCLEKEWPAVELEAQLIQQAARPIHRMLEVSAQ